MPFFKFFSLTTLLCLTSFLKAQEEGTLINQIEQTKGLEKAQAFHDLIIKYYREGNYDSAYYWATERLEFAKSLGNDSVQTEAIIRIGQIFDKQLEFEQARDYFRQAYHFSKKKNYKYGMGKADLKIALSFYKETEFDSSIYYSSQAEKIFSKLENKEKLTVAYTGMGNCYLKQGNLVSALDNYFKSLELEQQLNDTAAMASSYQNIGAVYYYQDETDDALKYFLKALHLKELMGNEGALIGGYHNVGAIYKSLNDKDSSLLFYRKALGLATKLNRQEFIALSSTTIGSLHLEMENYDSARIYLNKALKIQNEIDDRMSVIYTLRELGILEAKTGQSKKAIEYLDKAKTIGEEENLVIELLDVYDYLYQVYEDQKQFDKAFENYKKFVAVKDTLINEEVQEQTIKRDLQYQFDKEKLQDSLNHEQEKAVIEATASANEAKKDAEIKAGKLQTYLLIGGLIMIITFLGFVFNRLKITRKQKDEISQQKIEIESQKHEVEEAHNLLAEHHKEIQDSINYAKRIQEAIMPSLDAVYNALKNVFILYLPKDVVAGDFFWVEQVDDIVYFAAADCTGHGVPGAMVSVVCSNALTKALLEEKITNTGNLLDRTRELVVSQLAKSGEEVKDGMDISLCALNMTSFKLHWSGANNPLWILRKDTQEIDEIKADKQPIGKTFSPKPFTTHELSLQKGDTIYIFTDGYQDQFGGPRGKKFKAAQLKTLLLGNRDKSMASQKSLLHNTLMQWKESLEQIDDVCIIGVRI